MTGLYIAGRRRLLPVTIVLLAGGELVPYPCYKYKDTHVFALPSTTVNELFLFAK